MGRTETTREGPRAAGCLAFALCLLCAARSAQAQESPQVVDAVPHGSEFTISHEVIAAGGIAHARSACFDLAGTIGQAVGGRSQAGPYLVDSGFWAAPITRDSIFRSSFEGCQP